MKKAETGSLVYLCTVIPVQVGQLFVNEDGNTYRSTSSVWSTWGEAEEWGEVTAAQAGIDELTGQPFAVHVVQETEVDGFRPEGTHGLN